MSSTYTFDRRVRAIVEPLLLGLAALLFLALVRYHWQFVCDDAFIAFRYARNLVAGKGPVWNPGEAVEGFSSPLWLGLLALGEVIGLPLAGWAGGLGVAFLAACLYLVHRSCLAVCPNGLAAAIACVATTLVYPFYYWAAAGLETTMFAALVTAMACSLLSPSPRGLAPVAACLGIARPEGPFLVVAFLVLAAVAHGRGALRPRRVAVALAPMLLWLVFRRIYYGDWLSNPYYAKATGDLWLQIAAGLIYALWALLAWAATLAAAWLGHALDRKIAATLAAIAFLLAMVVGEGGDWMWHARMVAPALPALAAVAAGAIARASSQRRLAGLFACVLAWSVFLPKVSLLVDALGGGLLPSSSFQEGTLAQASFQAARYIADRYPKQALVAVNHAGALPFALGNPAIDMTGLADRHIAHERSGSVHRKFDAAYVLSRKPDLVVLNSDTRPGADGVWYHPGYWEGETALVEQPAWQESYRPVDAFWEWHWIGDAPRFLVLFEKIP